MKRLLFLRGTLRIFDFAVLVILSCRSLHRFLYQKSSALWFWCPLRFAVSVLFRSSGKNKIGLSDLLFGDADFGFSSYNMDLLLGYCLRFLVLIEIYFGFAVFCYFLYGFTVFNTIKCRSPFYHSDD